MENTPLISHVARGEYPFGNQFYFVDDLPPLPACGNCDKKVTQITQTGNTKMFLHVDGDFCMAVQG